MQSIICELWYVGLALFHLRNKLHMHRIVYVKTLHHLCLRQTDTIFLQLVVGVTTTAMPTPLTVMIQSFRTDIAGQTVQT